ncbi:hypothetical protein J5N97_029187 [Dioscorea zingiberensis]|uniref:Uncharacterized protein n=1 Tax=Dioscorea zingiberensis TaxID=325984 RepID=A0A9D5H5N2_9LILI|nr:hypothetical protein J5N97_029187 [Dioscorea zingiberensis]
MVILCLKSLVLFFMITMAVSASDLNGSATPFPALIVFGDSIMDTGNNNLLPTISKCNFLPYGKDFSGHRPTGRFSNGKVPSDLIASRLGIKEIVPAYLNPELEDKDLPTGVCFASGSSGYDPLTSQLNSVLSMNHQLVLFKDYKWRLKEYLGEANANVIIEKSLFVVSSGSNDVANTYFGATIRRAQYSFSDYAKFLVQSASSFVQELHQLGARSIAVLGLPPLGCLPSQRTLAGGLQRDCVSLYNQASQEYNSLLITELKSLSNRFSGSTIIYVDIYNKLLGIIQHPKHYGLEVSTNGCCGTGKFELGILLASVPAVIAFGDSLIDPGNNNVLKTVSKCDFPPYGRDFPGHKPTGRWSNGKIPTDFITSYLGIKEYLPAYLDTELKDSDLLTGVSFASGGSGFDNITAKIAFANVLTLWDQLKLFEDYKEKLKVIVGEEEMINIVSNSLYIVCAGTNDLAWTYFTARLRKEYDLPSYIDFMLNSASSFLNDLYGLGARKIGVIGISSIGCLPLERTVNGGISRDCVDSHNQASLKFNYKLITELERLASELPGSSIVFMDVYDSVLDLIQNPEKHGIQLLPS